MTNLLSPFARQTITHSPTPLEYAPRLSKELGINLYIKRDDCTGLAGGGNKTRKLEYLIADAQACQADTLITIGGLQSNHARQTAAAAAKFGLNCELVLQDVAGTPKQDYFQNGNMLLDNLFGANMHQLAVDEDCEIYAQTLIESLIEQGRTPYLIPMGGSNDIGSLGYVRCAQELVTQVVEQNLEIQQIILATGSAGTQAGLLAGLIAYKKSIEVLGINVSRSAEEQTELVENLLIKVLDKIGIDSALSKGIVDCNGDYFGEGYGIVTEQMIEAVRLSARLEGLLLDPVYSGKAMAGLIDRCRRQLIAPGSNIIFLHTGGSTGLFAYKSVFFN